MWKLEKEKLRCRCIKKDGPNTKLLGVSFIMCPFFFQTFEQLDIIFNVTDISETSDFTSFDVSKLLGYTNWKSVLFSHVRSLTEKKPPRKGLHVLFNVSCLTFSFSAPTSLCQLNAKLFLSFLACYIEMAIFSQFLLTFV